MNRADFLNMIESKSPVDRRTLGEIYDLINIFPYFQSAHMLLLKGLQDNNDVRFENQLKNSAIHISNRELLYYYLRNDTPAASINALEKPSRDYVIKEEVKVEEEIKEEVKVEVQVEEKVEDEVKDEVKEVLAEEVSVNFETEALILDEDFSPEASDDLLELIDEDEVVEEIPAPKPDTDGKNSRKQLQSELIDKFIITNPRIEASREKTDQPAEDLSKSSADESGVFVTDTLAQIYVHQGYYSKAIDIYEKLSLKFPEKSTYFATQIEKVKEYLKK